MAASWWDEISFVRSLEFIFAVFKVIKAADVHFIVGGLILYRQCI